MPELPEVETIKKTLMHFVINQTIEDVHIEWPNIIKHPDDTQAFAMTLQGETIRDIGRKGKFLLFQTDDYVLVSHLRMEGKFSFHDQSEPIKKHTHVRFLFKGGKELRYNDVRKFGTMHVFNRGDELHNKPLVTLGPDPFDPEFNVDYFYKKLKGTKRVIKSALLDQTIVAGLGNIYVDETLFKAGVHPLKESSKLTKNEVIAIHKQAIDTLEVAVTKGGTTIRSYLNGQGQMGMFQQDLKVYAKAQTPCQTCNTPIIKIKIGGRGTHICPTCQKR